MAQPTIQLNATEQDTLVKQIGLALLRAAPPEWSRITVDFRAVGRYHEMTGQVTAPDETVEEWNPTQDIAALFNRLRGGMYRDGRGTWFNARYQLDYPTSYNLEYNREEPRWGLEPPSQAYADELRIFPRAEENVPEWLARRLSGLSTQTRTNQPGSVTAPAANFRMARIFDGHAGHPVINRPELDRDEQQQLLRYLDNAPVVLSERRYDVDLLASSPVNSVPVAFHTDGTWIWPAAVNYYLREYGVAPENDLVQHIHDVDFTIADISEHTMQAARAHLTRGNPPGAPAPPARPVEHFTTASATAEQGHQELAEDDSPFGPDSEPPYHEHFDDSEFADVPEAISDGADNNAIRFNADHAASLESTSAQDAHPPTVLAPPVPNGKHAGPAETASVNHPGAFDQGPPTQLVAPVQPPLDHAGQQGEHAIAEPALDQLQEKLTELAIPESAYHIGQPGEHGWSVEKVDSGWRVGLYDGELTNPAVFGDADDAAAFMLGKLLLQSTGQSTGGAPEPAIHERQPTHSGAHQAPNNSPAHAPSDGQVRAPHEPEPTRLTMTPVELPRRSPTEPPRRPSPEQMWSPPLHHAAPPIPEGPPPSRPRPDRGGEPRLADPAMASPPRGMPSLSVPAGHVGTPRREPTPHREEEVRPTHSAQSTQSDDRQAGQGAQGGQPWPIEPFPGEPPLTLFRGKEMKELPVGSEIDRFGDAQGNLTYAAGTPFAERSLVPEWINRPYRVYRVQHPLEALAGVAIPWFNQPGGGAAYLLPASIEELLASGDLIELEPGEPPVS